MMKTPISVQPQTVHELTGLRQAPTLTCGDLLQFSQHLDEPFDESVSVLVEEEPEVIRHLLAGLVVGDHDHDVIGQLVVHVHFLLHELRLDGRPDLGRHLRSEGVHGGA